MIVGRITINIKPGRMEEAVAVLKAEIKRAPAPGAVRVYTPNIAPFDVLAVENEWESAEQSEKWWTEHFADPGTADFYKRWVELRAGGGTNEFWNLVE